MVVGDSLSAAYALKPEYGWVKLLADRIEEKNLDYKVVNASVSGASTADGLRELPLLLEKHQPQIVIIELGYNDGGRGYPLMTMKKNLSNMIELAQKAKAKVLLLGCKLPNNYGAFYTKSFNQIYIDLADKYDTKLVPFFMQGFAENPQYFQADGVHPTAKAQPLILDNVWPYLEPMLNSKK